jgi:hypothetical protein
MRSGHPSGGAALEVYSARVRIRIGSPTGSLRHLKALVLRHKAASAGAAAVLLIVLSVLVPAVLPGGAGALSDSASCSDWASASQSQQNAYSQRYLNEHGALPSGAGDVTGVRSAINNDCIKAAYLGESDDVTIIAAIEHAY